MGNKIQKIYVGTDLVRPVQEPRTPGANTVAYYPLREDVKDYSGNGYDFSVYSGSVSYSNNMATINGKLSRNNLITSLGNNFTILMYTVQQNGETYLFTSSDRNYAQFYIGTSSNRARIMRWNNNVWYGPNIALTQDGIPHLIVGVRENTSTVKLYIDGELKGTSTVTISIPSNTYMVLGNVVSNTLSAKYGNLILENRAWTDGQILAYYNQTKGDYGIS